MSKKGFEMAHSDDPKEMIMATQRALISMLKDIIKGIRADVPKNVPGMTWEQIDFLLDLAAKKEPIIITQEEPM